MVILGEAHYISALPLYHSLKARIGPDVALHAAGLTELTARLGSQQLAAGPIAPIEYLRNPDRYTVLSRLALSSLGRSNCVSLFSRRPAYELKGARIAVPIKATGAVALLRWLMREMYRFDPLLVPRTGGLAESMAENDGVLLFQDAALQANAGTADLYHIWDLGEAWWQITHTPLLYMLWVARRDLPDATIAQLHGLLEQAKADLPHGRESVLDEAQRRISLPRHLLGGYFDRFQYDFTAAHEESLDLYGQTVATLVDDGVSVS